MASPLEITHNREAKDLKHQEEEDGILFALKLMTSMAVPMVVQTAVDLGIFNIIAKAGDEGVKLSAQDIASQIGSKNPEAPNMLDRLLRLMASHSMLSCSLSEDGDQQHGLESPNRLYGLAPASKYFVADADGVTFGHILNVITDKVYMETWAELKVAILEGGTPFDRVYGMDAFEYQGADPRFNDVFSKAMLSHTTIMMKKVLEFYEGFEHINRLVDVGGSLGINLKLITSKYPHIKGINFDLPHVIGHATSFAGVEHVGGDMFDSVPNGDAIFLKCILHDWSDEHCLKLLKNCHKAIPDDGKVIVVETMLPVLPEGTITSQIASQTDLLMMTHNPGGKERTQHEFMQLATGSGFRGIQFVCCVCGFWVMEWFK